MIDLEKIILRNIEYLNNLKKEYEIKETLYNLVFSFDRLIINQDPKQNRIRLIGVLVNSNENEELEDLILKRSPTINKDMNIDQSLNISRPVDIVIPHTKNNKEKRKQLYVLKKSQYIKLTEEKLNKILFDLNYFRLLLKELKCLRNTFEEEQKLHIYFELNKLKTDSSYKIYYKKFIEFFDNYK